jgi:hypothetical protein
VTGQTEASGAAEAVGSDVKNTTEVEGIKWHGMRGMIFRRKKDHECDQAHIEKIKPMRLHRQHHQHEEQEEEAPSQVVVQW